MHEEAMAWVTRELRAFAHPAMRVLEFGSRDVNGSARRAFPGVSWHGIDREPGPGVDEVADAAGYDVPPGGYFDAVVCTEVLEHASNPTAIIEAAQRCLRPGGVLLVTAACDPRAPHSAIDGGPLRLGEHYRNVSEEDVRRWRSVFGDDRAVDGARGLLLAEWHRDHGDVYVRAWL